MIRSSVSAKAGNAKQERHMSLSFGRILLVLVWASAMLAQAVSADSPSDIAALVVKEIDEHYLYASDAPWKKARAEILGTVASNRDTIFVPIRRRLAELRDSELHLVTASELAAIQRESEGKTVGTGLIEFSIDVVPETREARVVTPLVGSPGAIAGLRPRDVIAAVNGRPTRELDHEQVLGYLRSPADADLLIRRGKGMLRVHIVPSDGPLHPVLTRWLPAKAGGVAYLRVVQFTPSAPDAIHSAIEQFEPQHPRGYVLDLRNNPGGFLDAASKVCGFFISGDLGEKVRRNGNAEPITTEDSPVTQAPVVVLVNGGTASAAEFVAGALQARHRAVLVGTPTYGRGQAQMYEPLPEGYGLIIPSALIRTTDGRLFKGAGLMPDVRVASGPRVEAGIEPGHDPQLRRAILLLSKGKQ
jgi:carboxyl-terminal processing protease